MAKRNVTKEVQEQITEMVNKKAADLDAIRNKQTEARTRLEAAELAIKAATETMNLDAYEKATAARNKAKIALDMYAGRYLQIQKQEYISEEESDKVIDSLKAYEDQLEEDFKKSLVPLLKKLEDIHTNYTQAVQDTESTIQNWTASIHANYRVDGALYANGTNRNDKPQPVRRLPFTGCGAAETLGKYLEKAKAFYE